MRRLCKDSLGQIWKVMESSWDPIQFLKLEEEGRKSREGVVSSRIYNLNLAPEISFKTWRVH